MSFDEILNTDKPDREIEHFWLTLKQTIIRYLDQTDIDQIEYLSNQLNSFQIKQDYKMIERLIKEQLEKIGYSMIIKGNMYNLHILDTNFRRWKRISSEDIMKDDNIFYCLFKIYILINSDNKKNETEGRIEITKLIQEYAKTKELTILYAITSIAIKENYFGILEKIRMIIDIRQFATEEGLELFKKHDYNKMRIIKFNKYLKPI